MTGNNLPVGATLQVKAVGSLVLGYLQKAMGQEDTALAYDIKVLDADGNEWQPAEGETVQVTVSGVDAEDGQIDVIHILDTASAIERAVASGEAVPLSMDDLGVIAETALELFFRASRNAAKLAGFSDEIYTSELSGLVTDGVLSFETDSFSVYSLSGSTYKHTRYKNANTSNKVVFFDNPTASPLYVTRGQTILLNQGTAYAADWSLSGSTLASLDEKSYYDAVVEVKGDAAYYSSFSVTCKRTLFIATYDQRTFTFYVVPDATVIFDTQGGSDIEIVTEAGDFTKEYNMALGNGTSTFPYASIALPSTSYSGNLYVFDGWYTEASGGTYVGGANSSYTISPANGFSTSNPSKTLYAHWAKNYSTATVNYVFEGDSSLNATRTQQIAYGNSYTFDDFSLNQDHYTVKSVVMSSTRDPIEAKYEYTSKDISGNYYLKVGNLKDDTTFTVTFAYKSDNLAVDYYKKGLGGIFDLLEAPGVNFNESTVSGLNSRAQTYILKDYKLVNEGNTLSSVYTNSEGTWKFHHAGVGFDWGHVSNIYYNYADHNWYYTYTITYYVPIVDSWLPLSITWEEREYTFPPIVIPLDQGRINFVYTLNGEDPDPAGDNSFGLVYNANTSDTVTGMPYGNYVKNISAEQYQFYVDGLNKAAEPGQGGLPVRSGYTFLGWDTDASATDPTYKPYESSQKVPTITINEGVTVLYAIWEPSVAPTFGVTEFTVTFHPNNGEASFSQTVKYGDTVTKPADPQLTAGEFAGWYTTNLYQEQWNFDNTVTADMDLYGAWTQATTYTLTVDYVYSDGSTAAASYSATVTANTAYSVDSPSIDGYTADRTTVSGTMPASNLTVTVTYSINSYTVTWMVDGAETTEVYEHGATPSFKGSTDKAADAQYTYTFAGWDPTVVAVTADAVYTATYTSTVNKYTVTWKNEDGTVLETDENVVYGATPSYDGETPSKEATAQYTYTFNGWDQEIAAVTGNVTYTATYSSTVNKYTVTYPGADSDGDDDLDDTTTEIQASKTVTIDPNGGTWTPDDDSWAKNSDGTYTKIVTEDTEIVNEPAKAGYEFVGWSSETDNDGNVTLAAQWKYVVFYYPVVPTTPTVSVKGLNTVDHVAYIIGIGENKVDPLGTITRAEVATIYFRLMTEEFRTQFWSDENSYTDVADTAWYNVAVSTLENAGVIKDTAAGGNFRPNDPITRAELAVMAAQFASVTGKIPATSFTDVPADHWAAGEIAIVEYAGWIEGYNGYYRPEDNLTRAECVTIVNRMLKRGVEAENMLENMVVFVDNSYGTWYYEAVQEAANSHTYSRTSALLTGEKFRGEKWTALLDAPDWAALEKAWVKANSR